MTKSTLTTLSRFAEEFSVMNMQSETYPKDTRSVASSLTSVGRISAARGRSLHPEGYKCPSGYLSAAGLVSECNKDNFLT